MTDILPKSVDPKRLSVCALPITVGVVCRRIPNDTLHIHDCTELWYCLSGVAIHYVGTEQYTQTPGTCIALPSFLPHEISTIDSEDTPVFLCVNVFDNALRKRGYDYFSYHGKRIYFEGKLLPIYHQFSGAELETANDIAHELSTEFSKHKKLNFNKLLELYVSFLRLLGGEKTTLKITPSIIERTEIILTACDYIGKHYSEKITIEKLCKLTHMSRSRLCEYFSEITGFSPIYYLKCIRMNVARIEFMLRGKTLSEIAELTGIYGKAHLSRMFKEHFGESFSEVTRKRKQRELLLDRETRKKYANLSELSEFFENQNTQ